MGQDAILPAAGLAVLGLVALFVIASLRWDQKWLRQLKDLSAEHGWDYRPAAGFRLDCVISGRRNDIPWTLTYRRQPQQSTRNSQNKSSAEWRSTAACHPGGPVVIIARPPTLPVGQAFDPTGMGMMLLGLVLAQIGVGSSGMTLQEVGSTLFRERYLALGRSPEDARAMLTSSVEGQLLNWPKGSNMFQQPAIVADQTGVSVRIFRDTALTELFGSARMEYERQLPGRLVGLGVAAVDAARDRA